jgi:hypothetical protein
LALVCGLRRSSRAVTRQAVADIRRVEPAGLHGVLKVLAESGPSGKRSNPGRSGPLRYRIRLALGSGCVWAVQFQRQDVLPSIVQSQSPGCQNRACHAITWNGDADHCGAWKNGPSIVLRCRALALGPRKTKSRQHGLGDLVSDKPEGVLRENPSLRFRPLAGSSFRLVFGGCARRYTRNPVR